MIRALYTRGIAAWNTYARSRGKDAAARADAAAVRAVAMQHDGHAVVMARLLNEQLRAIETHGYGTQSRLTAQLVAERTREMWLFHCCMAGGDAETAAEHRRTAYEIGAMLARVPAREMVA